jgi:uncharacterized protein (TIGR00255 family)
MSGVSSMTGFGAASAGDEGEKFAVTARSVNHRFLDLGLHVPRRLLSLEVDVRRLVQARIARGRVEVSIQAETRASDRQVTVAPPAFVSSVVDALKRIQREYALPGEVRIGDVVRLPGVVEVTDGAPDEDGERRTRLLSVVDEALEALVRMRRAEGAHLEEALREALSAMEEAALRIEALSADEKDARREAVLERLAALKQELGLEDGRLYQEAVKAAERMDVTEELARLRSHVAQARDALAAGAPCGKRLDFLAQEMAREAGTIGAKSPSAALAHAVVALKGEVERFREQVQNVE